MNSNSVDIVETDTPFNKSKDFSADRAVWFLKQRFSIDGLGMTLFMKGGQTRPLITFLLCQVAYIVP